MALMDELIAGGYNLFYCFMNLYTSHFHIIKMLRGFYIYITVLCLFCYLILFLIHEWSAVNSRYRCIGDI